MNTYRYAMQRYTPDETETIVRALHAALPDGLFRMRVLHTIELPQSALDPYGLYPPLWKAFECLRRCGAVVSPKRGTYRKAGLPEQPTLRYSPAKVLDAASLNLRFGSNGVRGRTADQLESLRQHRHPA